MPIAASRATASEETSAFGRRSIATSETLITSLRSTGRVRTAVGTVSITVPVRRSRTGALSAEPAIS